MIATGIGSLPGEDVRAAVRMVFGELGAELPYLPELPARGALATMTGRAVALLVELDADLQPAGWRLTGSGGSPGVDHRRARSLLAEDLDAVEEEGQAYAGAYKVQVCGPWTLAATVERPRGDKLLADHGARRELAQSLTEGVRGHIGDVRRRLSGVDRLVVQVDEPALAAVLAGQVPTASGYGRHRSIGPEEASRHLEWLFAAIVEAGAEPWLHSCASGTPLELVRKAGAQGLAVDLDVAGAADHDQLAESLEAGMSVVLGMAEPSPAHVERWLDMLGLDPSELAGRLLVSPACGLAGSSVEEARRTTARTLETARALR